ncbi:hypothetical protein XJ28_10540 [Pseudomonas syringae pv. tomato]|nr:hypothetical protein XJ28_10540 [Pseudomonas syringae pv. tomato]QBI64155.1 hypothetical protein EIZ61_23250 [Pseudomonas syringae]TES64627.1 hypothetical protein E2N90_23095 [Pseudomonas syringae pv. tomato]
MRDQSKQSPLRFRPAFVGFLCPDTDVALCVVSATVMKKLSFMCSGYGQGMALCCSTYLTQSVTPRPSRHRTRHCPFARNRHVMQRDLRGLGQCQAACHC